MLEEFIEELKQETKGILMSKVQFLTPEARKACQMAADLKNKVTKQGTSKSSNANRINNDSEMRDQDSEKNQENLRDEGEE